MHSVNLISYGAVNSAILPYVPPTAKRVLDVGCGTGTLGKVLKQEMNCEVVGLTYSNEEAKEARDNLDQIIVCDLNTYNFEQIGRFDCIICSHVLEHLYDPGATLERMRANLAENGILIVALPNILHWRQRIQFLKGHFRYTNGGLMDSTHFRFFDWETSLELVQKSGFKIAARHTDGYFPLPVLRNKFGALARSLDKSVTKARPGLFGTQFIIVGQVL